MSEKVEMIPAYFWICPNCDAENFERGIVVERSPEEIAELRDMMGVEEHEIGSFVQMPDVVICGPCGRLFDALHYLGEHGQ